MSQVFGVKVTNMQLVRASVFLFACLASPLSLAGAGDCGSLKNGFGPFDYTDPANHGFNLQIVEAHHFTPQVEALQKGQEGTVPGDLDYVLRAFPNHPRALYSMMRYQLNGGKAATTEFRTMECYFDRALRLKSDDPAVHLLYGIYLHKKHRYDEALKRYQESDRLKTNNPEVYYNLGLLYADKKDYGKAADYAHKAYAKGYQLPGLRTRLKRAGHWKN